MSRQSEYPIRCPKCGFHQKARLYDVVNVKENPELRAQLMENKLNHVSCERCAFDFRIDKTLLYSDPDRRLLILWAPLPESEFSRGEERFGEMVREISALLPEDMRTPALHLVFSRIELVERIFLIEAGLDERIIEYIKYTIYTRNAERLRPDRKILLFDATDSTPEHLVFVVQDAKTRRFEAMLQYSREAYRALEEAFRGDQQSIDLLEMFPGPHISARALLLREEMEESAPGPEPTDQSPGT